MLTPTAQKAVEVYGGRKRWLEASRIEAEISVHGLAFMLKGRPFFRHARIEMAVQRPYSRLTPIGRNPSITGVLDGPDVRLEDRGGNIVAEREQARQYFPNGRRLFYWDDLDMAYFANYALWNYFTFPRLLLNDHIHWEEIRTGLLRGTFPDTIPTHSRIQSFHFDLATGLLRQHDYTVDIISPLATPANIVTDHQPQSGFLFPTSRVVTPRTGSGKVLKMPVLIAITVHRLSMKEAEG
jgi:hypothetical protein